MASESQSAASRRNGALSRGPKTNEGKAVSSRNALRHGLSARKQLLAGESLEEFLRFAEELCASLRPTSALEIQLSQRIVSVLWRMQRIPVFEAALLAFLGEKRLGARAVKENESDEEEASEEENPTEEENPMHEGQEEQAIPGSVVWNFFKHDLDGKLSRYETGLLRQFSGLMKELTAAQERRREAEMRAQQRADAAAANPAAADFSRGFN